MAEEPKHSLENILRKTFQPFLDKTADYCIALGITANAVTLSGLVGDLIAAILIGSGTPDMGRCGRYVDGSFGCFGWSFWREAR